MRKRISSDLEKKSERKFGIIALDEIPLSEYMREIKDDYTKKGNPCDPNDLRYCILRRKK